MRASTAAAGEMAVSCRKWGCFGARGGARRTRKISTILFGLKCGSTRSWKRGPSQTAVDGARRGSGDRQEGLERAIPNIFVGRNSVVHMNVEHCMQRRSAAETLALDAQLADLVADDAFGR